jgi:Cytochrome P450
MTTWITLMLKSSSTTAASDTVSQWTIYWNLYMHRSLSVIYQTVSALMSLFVAMLLHPNVQKKAQEELDFAIGRERLPTFEDRPRLPFIDAVCKELLRWRLVNPLGTFCSYEVSPLKRHYTYNVLAGRYPTRRHKKRHICRFLHTER